MMLGWRTKTSIGRVVLLDPVFPWPALHYGREALRIYGTTQNKRRVALQDEGPMRMIWGLRASVKETGDALIAVWPTDSRGGPRNWDANDIIWWPVLFEMADFVGLELPCRVEIKRMPGGEPFERTLTVPSLRGVPGFYGWRKGEREPRASEMQRKIRDGILARQKGVS